MLFLRSSTNIVLTSRTVVCDWLITHSRCTAMDTGKQLNANELIAKLQELEKENAGLRKILDVHGIPYIVTEPNVTTKESLQSIFHTDSKLSLQEKVALFRSVFQGRDDVFCQALVQ